MLINGSGRVEMLPSPVGETSKRGMSGKSSQIPIPGYGTRGLEDRRDLEMQMVDGARD